MKKIESTQVYRYDTFEDMFDDLNRRFLQQDEALCQHWKTHMAKGQGIVLEVDSPSNTLNHTEFGYKSSRMKKFGRDYMDEYFWKWLRKVSPSMNAGEESGYFFTPKGVHNHGNCIWAMSYSSLPSPTLTLMSRTAFILPTGALEMTLVGQIADWFRKNFNEPLHLRWMLGQMQYTPLWAFPYVMSHPESLAMMELPEYRDSRMGVNFWRTHRNYVKYHTTDWAPKYHRAERLYNRSKEAAEGKDIRRIDYWPIPVPEGMEDKYAITLPDNA